MNRRQVLGLVGAGVVATAGCLGSNDESHATIQRFLLVNIVDEPVTVTVQIERTDSDELVHEERYELDAGMSGQPLDCVWPDAPLEVRTRRREGDDWSTYTTAGEEGCVALMAEANEHGTSYFAAHEDCPVRDPTCHPDAGT